MTHDLLVHEACGAITRAHTLQKNDKVRFAGLTDVEIIPASVHAETGRHPA